jgi:hypothetical protein
MLARDPTARATATEVARELRSLFPAEAGYVITPGDTSEMRFTG